MNTNRPTPQEVINAMREMKRRGCAPSGNGRDRAAAEYAVDQDFIEWIAWPAGFYRITPSGYDFIQENQVEE